MITKVKKGWKWYKNYSKEEKIVKFVYISVFINITSALFKIWLSISLSSLWFLVYAFYYLLLSTAKIFCIRDYKKIEKSKQPMVQVMERNNMISNGLIFILLSLIQGVSSIMIYYKGNVISYTGYAVYGLAFISFYDIGLAIYGMVKYRKSKNKTIFSIKMINFVSALVSILTTQMVLLQEFGNEIDTSRYNAWAGGGISLLICILGIRMLISIRNKKVIKTF